MDVVLYTTGCPQCNVLKQKLDDAGIDYETSTDVDKIAEMGFSAAPVLEVDGEYMMFRPAVTWVNNNISRG